MRGPILISIFLLLTTSCSKNREQKLLFVIAGQSNAMGVGDSTKSVYKELPCFEYNSLKNSFVVLKDPVGQDDLGFSIAKTGSFIPAFAYKYAELTKREVNVVQCAKGGSSLSVKAETKDWGNWDRKGKLLQSSFEKIDLALSAANMKGSLKNQITAIIWSQGENDGEAIGKGFLTAGEYKMDLKNLISAYRERYGTSLPFIIIETGRHSNCKECDEGYAVVRQIQQDVAAEDTHTYIGYNETKDFIERGWLKDPVHYNQEALNEIGEKLAKFMVLNKIESNLPR
ncbi:MAG: sialate O-acetylesterase [Aequorivita sp.]